MYNLQNPTRKVRLPERCKFNGHNLQVSNICVFKRCEVKRIGCIKCLDLHNHQLPTLSHYLSFQDFKLYIQEIVDDQLYNYNLNEELIKELQKIYQNSELIKKTIQSLQATQKTHQEHFKLAENRWDAPYRLSKQIVKQMIYMDGNHIRKQFQENSELLSQLQQNGIQLHVKERKKQHQIQQFVMEEKCLKKQNFYILTNSEIPNLKISPNGAYVAYERNSELKIFKTNSNQIVVNKRIKYLYFNISYTNDSQFYLYCDGRFVYFQAIRNSQKRIFGKVQIQIGVQIIFMNRQEFLIYDDDYYLRIVNIKSRSTRKIITGELVDPRLFPFDRIFGFQYDDQNNVIICGKQNKILFYNSNTGSLIFQKYFAQNDINQIKLLEATTYLICGSQQTHQLFFLNYQRKEIYLLNQFTSGYWQSLSTIFHFRYAIIMIVTGIIILDENFREIQFIEFTQELPNYFIESQYQIVECKKDKIKLIKSHEEIDYTFQQLKE